LALAKTVIPFWLKPINITSKTLWLKPKAIETKRTNSIYDSIFKNLQRSLMQIELNIIPTNLLQQYVAAFNQSIKQDF